MTECSLKQGANWVYKDFISSLRKINHFCESDVSKINIFQEFVKR